MQSKGFRVARARSGRVIAVRGDRRIMVDGPLGLATSSVDLLDALAPAVPAILGSREKGEDRPDALPRYASFKRSPRGVEVQLFTRMESSRTWTSLRREGLCGLTPDEALAIRAIAGPSQRYEVECVTDRPQEGSKPIQIGRRVYYRSSLPVSAFLGQLRTTDAEPAAGCYLPRNSLLSLPARSSTPRLEPELLGEWCCV